MSHDRELDADAAKIENLRDALRIELQEAVGIAALAMSKDERDKALADAITARERLRAVSDSSVDRGVHIYYAAERGPEVLTTPGRL